MLSLREVLELMPAAVLEGAPEVRFDSVSTDTRSIGQGALFIALRGERFDGHDYLAVAKAQGAVAAIVDCKVAVDLPQVVVTDTRLALGYLALGWRRRFDTPVILVTGSNGKTTTKEMIAAILAAAFGESGRLATRGNLNNEIGLPLTLLRLRSAHHAVVIELGMNHPGETAWLAAIAEPDVVVITNAQREHQEFMESVLAVAHEHALALKTLRAQGVGVFPADDQHSGIWREAVGEHRVLDFALSLSEEPGLAAVFAVIHQETNATVVHMSTPVGALTTTIHVPGLHNVRNAAAATAAALAIGIDPIRIREGLENFRPVNGRMQSKKAFSGALLIDDTYNANPDSVRAAIEVLAARPSPRLLILGDMGEVGAHGQAYHQEVAELAAQRGIERLMVTGEMMHHAVDAFGANASHFERIEDLKAAAISWITGHGERASVLVKGSRFMAMERIVQGVVMPDCTLLDSDERH